jgi:two-component system nitrogen regulation sensor histidine kinase NtrY
MARQVKTERLSFQDRIVLLAVLAGLPGSFCALVLLWSDVRGGRWLRILDVGGKPWVLTVLIAAVWIGVAFAVRERVVFPLQTVSNLLAALREGDFSVRGRSARPNDALGEVMREVNHLGSTLREQRLGAMEATTLLRTVMREIDVAVFAFDERERLRLANRAGERLLDAGPEELLGRSARELGLDACLNGPEQTTFEAVFPGGAGRWGVRRTRVRERGLPLELVVISDLTKALSEQELEAWQRLVRVLGHELNNSLAPIKSIAGSLESMLARGTHGGGLARRHAARAGRDYVAVRQPEPLHRRLCAAGTAAAPHAAALERGRGGGEGGAPRNAAAGWDPSWPPDHRAGRSGPVGTGA